ncbi:MAG: hypothetical protein KIC77_07975 [Clostridiales bacterium]|nr:hypothetical protein [Clostridiales bacterium]
MISDYDLLDLSAIFVLMRYDISNENNIIILTKVIDVLSKGDTYYIDNQIRIALASLSYLDKEAWEFVYHNNVYVTYRFLENKIIYSILVQSCIAVKEALANDELEKAYDLFDCIHCLPEIIADNKLKIPKNYWKTHVSIYRKKWDKMFLINEEKLYLR